jgi:agmatine deiminase
MPHMPAEWEPHERTWMAWPPDGYLTSEDNAAYAAWTQVAHAVARFEPLTMVVDPRFAQIARRWLRGGTKHPITLLEAPLDDAWMRDIGPTFVQDSEAIIGIDWVFNGWGAQHWATWSNDQHIARTVCEAADVELRSSPLVNEGGGLHVDGRGTILVTDTVQLDPGRNPNWTRAQVEEELKSMLGVDRVVWLPRGLTRDYEDFGTRGHVDIVATFTPSGDVLLHDQQNPEHPDFEVTALVRQALVTAGLTVRNLPAPKILRDEHGWVDYSYVNHYVVNGGVIACSFADPHDEVARQVISEAYPNREVVLVDARELFARGGGIHCITQQQPAVMR